MFQVLDIEITLIMLHTVENTLKHSNFIFTLNFTFKFFLNIMFQVLDIEKITLIKLNICAQTKEELQPIMRILNLSFGGGGRVGV